MSQGKNKTREGYSENLCNILESMLQVDPEDRPTFEEVRDYLVRELDMNCTGADIIDTPTN